MTREQHLQFCKICKNQAFDSKRGIICGLTNEIADFEQSCPDFDSDEKVSPTEQGEMLLDNGQRAKSALTVFWIMLAVTIVYMGFNLYEYIFLDEIHEEVYLTDFSDFSGYKAITILLDVLIQLVAIVVFLMWFVRAYKNLHRLRINHLEYSAAWAGWSFFIPIVNLFQPYQIAREILSETIKKIKRLNPYEPIKQDTSIVGWWWAFWILTTIMNRIAYFLDPVDVFNIEVIRRYDLVMTISNALGIVAIIMVIQMIRKISRYEGIMLRHHRSTDEESKLI